VGKDLDNLTELAARHSKKGNGSWKRARRLDAYA
jgi:hypothetical protein